MDKRIEVLNASSLEHDSNYGMKLNTDLKIGKKSDRSNSSSRSRKSRKFKITAIRKPPVQDHPSSLYSKISAKQTAIDLKSFNNNDRETVK